jgi:hypothetical protein
VFTLKTEFPKMVPVKFIDNNALVLTSKTEVFSHTNCIISMHYTTHHVASSTLHAHFAPLPLVEESVRCRLRGHDETGWPIRSHGQACNLQLLNRTVHHQSHLGTCTQFVASKQATPTAFDPCPPAGVPTMHFREIHNLCCPTHGRFNDELTPSK